MRVVILKIGRGCLRKVVEELIINVMKSGDGFKLTLAREDAQAGHLTDSMSLTHRTVRNSCHSPDLTTVNDLYALHVRERAGLNASKLKATQYSAGYSTQKASCM